ncbi:histidine phosphatase superfamily [Peziza echinospora]|nr:histidine phosphatase superfamily [Peziza echinospora]
MAPKYLTLIRHGEGVHNLTHDNNVHDPVLTTTGILQCNELNSNFTAQTSPHNLPPPNLLVSSPLTRTLQTTLISFSTFLRNNPDVKILPLALLQETAEIPCDTGRSVEELKLDFSGKGNLTGPELGDLEERSSEGVVGRIEWGALDRVFPSKEGVYRGEQTVLEERARLARKWFWEREEEHIVGVLHGGFLHYMTEDWTDLNPTRGTGWFNAEYRTFEFLSEDENGGPSRYPMREIEWSRNRRLGKEKPLTDTEEMEYEETKGHGK